MNAQDFIYISLFYMVIPTCTAHLNYPLVQIWLSSDCYSKKNNFLNLFLTLIKSGNLADMIVNILLNFMPC